MKELWELFITFAKIGSLTFGGGLSMLPMLKYGLIERRGWVTEEELLDYYAVGQCTPGIIAVNTATFVGYKRRNVTGGIFATLGMVTPSYIIITIIAAFLQGVMGNAWVQHGLMGVRGVVCALMLNTVLTLAKKSLIAPVCFLICGVAFLLAMFTPIPLVLIVILAGAFGILWRRGKGEGL